MHSAVTALANAAYHPHEERSADNGEHDSAATSAIEDGQGDQARDERSGDPDPRRLRDGHWVSPRKGEASKAAHDQAGEKHKDEIGDEGNQELLNGARMQCDRTTSITPTTC
jgi:hypothetical protein